MPTFRHGKNTKVYFANTDLTTYFNQGSVSQAVDMGDTTTFGASGKTYVAGLIDAKTTLSGLFDGTANAVDQVLAAALGVEDQTFTYMMEGGVVGRRCYCGQVDMASYQVNSPVADVVSTSLEANADGGLFSGYVLAVDQSVSTATTTNGTGVDNGVLTSNGGIAVLHVTANAQTATTAFKIQHSVDNSVWVDLSPAFTTVGIATKTSERILIAAGTTVNRWLRVVATTTGTGAIVYSAAFARR